MTRNAEKVNCDSMQCQNTLIAKQLLVIYGLTSQMTDTVEAHSCVDDTLI